MRVLSIGADRSKRGILYADSPAFKRQQAYSETFGELYVIGFSRIEDGARNIENGGLRVYPTNSRSRWGYVFDAIKIAKRLPKPDVVSAQDPFEAGFAAWRIAKHFGVALHIQIHTDFLSPAYAAHSVFNRLRVSIAMFVLKRAKRIRAVSERIKKSIEKRRIHVPITVLPMYVDLEKCKSAQPVTDNQLLNTSRYKLLVVSRLTPEKNVGLAIRAFKRAAPNDACLIICHDGASPESDDNRIQFIHTKDVSRYYKSADLILVPSLYEGYGLVIIEALAAGKPVLSTDVGIAREAGAILTSPEKFTDALADWFKNGPREGHLNNYPYRDFDEYVKAYCDDVVAAI